MNLEKENSDVAYDTLTPEQYTNIIWKNFPIHDIKVNALGLCGEAGEFANKLKKKIYSVTITNDQLLEELADVLWHVAQCSKLLDSSLENLMAISAKKSDNRNK